MSTGEKNHDKLEEKPTRTKLEFGSKIATSKKELEEKVYNKYFTFERFKENEISNEFAIEFRNWVARFSQIIYLQSVDCKAESKSKSYLDKIKKRCDDALQKFVTFNASKDEVMKINKILSAIELVKEPINEVYGEIRKKTFPSSSRFLDSKVKEALDDISMKLGLMEMHLKKLSEAKK